MTKPLITPLDPSLLTPGVWVAWYPYRRATEKPFVGRLIESTGDDFWLVYIPDETGRMGAGEDETDDFGDYFGTSVRVDHIACIIPPPLG